MTTVYSAVQRLTPSATFPQDPQAGPSSSQPSIQKKLPLSSASALAPATKRKRNDTPEETSADSASPQPSRKGTRRDGPKKKKANRACYHCQKAHLTCDDSRPCQRCVKRGIADNCTEGHRKKAKYLLDDDELEQLKRGKSSVPETEHQAGADITTEAPQTIEPLQQNNAVLTTPFDPQFSFGSEAANLEYSILSAILDNSSPVTDSSSTTPPPSLAPQNYSSWPSDPIDFATSPRLCSANADYSSSYIDNRLSMADQTISASPRNAAHYLTYPYPQAQRSEPEIPFSPSYSSQPSEMHPLQPRYPLDARPRSPAIPVFLQNPKDMTSHGFSPSLSNSSPRSVTSGVADIVRPKSCGSKLQSINDRVTTPFDYTEGYHFLMKHLPTRFEKNDILRIVRALAIFRPSLIALQMPLSLDDEIFVEKCFQRTLLELDKLISFSGTPTVVWRRTGEICLVAPEFCMLTEWPLEDLLGAGRKKYIYELFENQSVVEYWENFASHAFENTTHSVYSHCVLLKPSGAPVPSTFCFSIRRDLFDLPSIVIGQWLPLL
ncbi:transcription activator of gluconeogenesis ERT1 [Phlegmacium glaucopus]|nr:transcription activator of gluconeogenesis ERT1 [Phlegmacium glaucopus]